jgi:hypothetical protein
MQPALLAPSLDFSTPASDGVLVSAGVPIHRISFPPSLSPIPTWITGSSHGTIFSSPSPHTTTSSLSWARTAPLGRPHAPGVLYGGGDGTLFSSDTGAPSGATPALFDAHPRDEASTQAASLYYKLEFPTYDGLKDR